MLKQFGFAPGNYMGKCSICGKGMDFVDKRASRCFDCAEKIADEEYIRIKVINDKLVHHVNNIERLLKSL